MNTVRCSSRLAPGTASRAIMDLARGQPASTGSTKCGQQFRVDSGLTCARRQPLRSSSTGGRRPAARLMCDGSTSHDWRQTLELPAGMRIAREWSGTSWSPTTRGPAEPGGQLGRQWLPGWPSTRTGTRCSPAAAAPRRTRVADGTVVWTTSYSGALPVAIALSRDGTRLFETGWASRGITTVAYHT